MTDEGIRVANMAAIEALERQLDGRDPMAAADQGAMRLPRDPVAARPVPTNAGTGDVREEPTLMSWADAEVLVTRLERIERLTLRIFALVAALARIARVQPDEVEPLEDAARASLAEVQLPARE